MLKPLEIEKSPLDGPAAGLPRRPAAPLAVIGWAFFFAAVCCVFGLLAVYKGQDTNWDLRNYHYYNPWALMHNRLTWDFAPAQTQTFFNPILDLPFYFLTRKLRPRTVGFILGTLHGLNWVLVFWIARMMLSGKHWLRLERAPMDLSFGLPLLAASLGSYGPVSWSELGGTMNDNLVSIPILASFGLILHQGLATWLTRLRPGPDWATVLSGLLAGAALAGKLTSAPCVAGLFLFLISYPNRRWLDLIRWGAGGLCGFLLTGGWWLALMAYLFKNPLFPMYNRIFKSEYALPSNYLDARYLCRDAYDVLLRPFGFLDPKQYSKSCELLFRDARFAIVEVILGAFVICLLVALIRRRPLASYRAALPYILFWCGAYILWAVMFGILRYLSPLEYLAPAFSIYLALTLCGGAAQTAVPLLCAILGFNAAWLQCPDWGRVGWSSKWFHTSMRGLPDLSHALLLDMDGRNPNSFVIPAIAKPGMRVVRLTGDLESIGQKDKYNEMMMQVVRSHSGPVFLLTSMGDAKEEIASAATLGFQEDKSPGEYAPVPNNADHSIVLIRLKR